MVAFFLLLTAILFRQFLTGNAVLLTTDAAITAEEYSQKPLIDLFSAHWRDILLVGKPHAISIQFPILLLKIFNTITWNNFLWPIASCLSSFALIFYLRSRSVSWLAGLLACLCAFWLGSNFTLLHAGHGQKFFVLLFFTLSVAFAQRTAISGRWYDAVLLGASASAMFCHQPDLALFCVLFLGPYVLFQLVQQHGLHLKPVCLPLVIAAIPALIIAGGPLLKGYSQNVRDVSVVQDQNPQQKWDYVTQWSWPPGESIDFIAPGYTGWRSGEPEGPYWGKMGRSSGWETSRQGFQNFKLESTYLGFIPLALALFGVFVAPRSSHRTEIYFWTAAAVVAFLLACGKFLPLYALFFKLPAVNAIRNPNKFLQVFQLATAILAAYGGHALLVESHDKSIRVKARYFCWFSIGVAMVMALCLFAQLFAKSEGISYYLSQYFPQAAAQVIVENKRHALLHGIVMAIGMGAIFALFGFPKYAPTARRNQTWIAATLVLIVSVDVVLLSRHYIKKMPSSYIQANELTRSVKKILDYHRVALLTQDHVYNIFVTYLFPFQGIQMFNTSSMPRMTKDYEAFFNAVGKMPIRMWRLCAVKYLIGPLNITKTIPPQVGQTIDAFDAGFRRGQELAIRKSPEGAHRILRLSQPAPRFALIAGSEIVSHEEVLARLADPTFIPFEKVLLPQDENAKILTGSGICGSINVLTYRAGRVRLHVQTERPAYLRLADRYDPDWRATLNGERANVLPCDFLFQAVFIPPGLHTIELRYAPNRFLFFLQCGGIATALCALATLMYSALQIHEPHSD